MHEGNSKFVLVIKPGTYLYQLYNITGSNESN